MITKLAFAALVAAAPLAVAAPAAAQGHMLTVTNAWSRPAAAGTTGAGFFTITNGAKAADALVGAQSPLAQKVEIHRSSLEGGVMRMSRQARVPIPGAGGRATFAPGGYHLMLIGLKKALAPGDSVPVTLSFASGARAKVDLKVGTGLAPAADSAHHHH
ncbi:copper chaperone PCu(A)C [Phenylobacterium sp.]|jgi:copper(I)-binding protein|uniref:copper chaperone PCu(A)C n=1 Tax=Phenylobacterium sp. TaxID=1871053 RepID=UPI002F9569B0